MKHSHGAKKAFWVKHLKNLADETKTMKRADNKSLLVSPLMFAVRLEELFSSVGKRVLMRSRRCKGVTQVVGGGGGVFRVSRVRKLHQRLISLSPSLSAPS